MPPALAPPTPPPASHANDNQQRFVPPPELGIPVVDLRNAFTRSKLAALGIVNYIPLGNFNRSGGFYGLPIVSNAAPDQRAEALCQLLGTDAMMTLGALKPLPIRRPVRSGRVEKGPWSASPSSSSSAATSVFSSATSSPTASSSSAVSSPLASPKQQQQRARIAATVAVATAAATAATGAGATTQHVQHQEHSFSLTPIPSAVQQQPPPNQQHQRHQQQQQPPSVTLTSSASMTAMRPPKPRSGGEMNMAV